MKFQAKQFCEAYAYFTFEADSMEHAQRILFAMNEGRETEVELQQTGFDVESGGKIRLIGVAK